MRKALIGLMMAATVLTPIAAQAQETQDVDRDGNTQRYERQAQRNAQRYEQRQQRQQARAEQQQAAPVQQQQAAPAQVAQRQRGERGGEWRRGGDRQQAQQQQAQQQQIQEQQVRQQQVQRQRGDRRLQSTTGWEGPRNDPRLRDDAARYDRRARENAVRYGTTQQRQEVRQDRRDWRQDRRSDRRDWSREWSRDSWRSDRRYDWQNYRYRNNNIFRVSRYYSPYRNHRYSRFSIGIFLNSLFYDQRYWIGDPWQYRLPAAPYGTQWVRYYDDVLLVDVYSGEVIDVIYDFFW